MTKQEAIRHLQAVRMTLIGKDGQPISDLYDALSIAIEALEQPTVNDLNYGEWLSGYDGFEYDVRCSVCGEEALIKEGGSHDHAYSHYCPHCGANMRKGEKDEQDNNNTFNNNLDVVTNGLCS